ncbi:FIST C-terminal domain-containing protein [Kineococcus sp. TRM81007]|uniref:FIST signal transduction protein n=1 Tax=Kineococcus sp. TRM81007 TaxID=2925831 RepID=UPI001F57DC85|nr:FIST N-terminal domain-containing protein [Kineococcus sp. TRM81007]MCI2239926.1 FIST C-terminal domain-containing protein [Kineococcus sp. TRM81007]
MNADRWSSVGSADAGTDVAASAALAVERARAGRRAGLLVVMARWDLDLAAVAAGVGAAAGGAAVVGTSTVTTYAGGDEAPAGVVVTAIGGPGVSVRTASAARDDPPYERGARVAAACRDTSRAHSTVLLLPNGTDLQQQAVVRGAYSELGPAVPIVGGGSGGDVVARRSWQLHGAPDAAGRTAVDVVENGLVGAWLGTDRPLGVGTAHGLQRVGEPMVVSDSDGFTVRALDGRPALDVYLEHLGVDAGALGEEALTGLGFAHPLGLVRRRREEVRTVVGLDVRERTLTFVSEVPHGSLVHVMAGDEEAVVAGAGRACRDAAAALGGATPAGMLVFSCVARRGLLSRTGPLREARAALEAAGGADVVLNYSNGEIARVSGAAGCHNQTVVALAL